MEDNNDNNSDYGEKYSRIQNQLNDFEEEDKVGFKVKAPTRKQENEWNMDEIEEDIQSEHDNHQNNKG